MDKNSNTKALTHSANTHSRVSASTYLVRQPWRTLLLLAGCCAVSLGVLGIFLPLLPTVPFLLLAAACFSRSSQILQSWLFNHKYLGVYLTNYLLRKGISKKQLISSLSSMWLAMLIAIFFTPVIYIKILLVVIACLVTRHLFSLRRLP
jgi:uncharacterized membrane protein YbaN (DUF454 family)